MERIEEAIEKKVEVMTPARERKLGVYHVSDIVKCPRYVYLDFFSTKKNDLPDSIRRIFAIGHLIHEFIQEALIENGVKKSDIEYKLLKDFVKDDIAIRIVGSIDVHLGDTIVEIKSSSRTGLEKVRDKHLEQANLYLGLQDRGAKKAIIYRVCKDNLKSSTTEHLFDQELFDKQVDWAFKLHQWLTNKKFPPYIPKKASCFMCGKRRECIEWQKQKKEHQ